MDKRYNKGQYGQDEIIDKLCYPLGKETHKGVFVEIGAWDGVDISNTYTLEKKRDWKGLLVEPIKDKAADCSHNRWYDVWRGCIYDRDGEVDFTHIRGYSEMLSCIKEDSHPYHKERIQREISQYNQQVETIKVPCKTINSLLNSFNIERVDILSLDVQSIELLVLKAYNVQKNPCKVIILDTNSINTDEIKEWFATNGYKLYWKHSVSDEYIFINHDLKWSWE